MISSIVNGLKAALNGFRLVWSQRNFRIEVVAAIAAVIFSLSINLNYLEIVILLLLIHNVFSAELFNTAVEDLSNQQKKLGTSYEDAGPARDMAAAAVLVQVIAAVMIGSIVVLNSIS